HMRAAVLAARSGQAAQARDHLIEAHCWAARVPEGAYNGTVFGHASVQIHEVALAVDIGDPDAALSLVARWTPPGDLPAERRSHFYIEVARANSRVGARDRALEALVTARTVAPEHVRDHPQVHQVLGELHGRAQDDDRLREYMRWV